MESEPLLRDEADPELEDDDLTGGGTAVEDEDDGWPGDLEEAPPEDEDDDL